MGQSKIVVTELSVSRAQRTEVMRCGDRLVLMIDEQAFELDADRATALAWSICTQVDAIRSEQVERSLALARGESANKQLMPIAA
jgi:recombinational DNA repair ATPase RecF